jgi:hypothetical protein
MKRLLHSCLLRSLALSLLGLAAAASSAPAQEKAAVPAGGTVNVTVTSGTTAPPVSIILHERSGHVTPCKGKCVHTGGGLIDVTSPSPDTVVITMQGLVLANAAMRFDLDQCFEVSFDDPKVKKAKLTVEGRVVGVLRGECCGCAEFSDACAHVSCEAGAGASISVPPQSICKCAGLGVNDHDGPRCLPAVPCCKYTLNQTFSISAHSKCCLCKKPSADFAPDPALDPIWISFFEPFHGIKKDTFGFQVTLKVAPETEEGNGDKKNGANGDKKAPEKVPAPQPGNGATPKL